MDPDGDRCFNCWARGHTRFTCRELRRLFCFNCGRRNVTMRNCPRCSDEHLSYLRGRDQVRSGTHSGEVRPPPPAASTAATTAGPSTAPTTSRAFHRSELSPAAASGRSTTEATTTATTVTELPTTVAGPSPGMGRRRSRWDQAETATTPPVPPPPAVPTPATNLGGGISGPMTVLEYFASVSHLPPDLQAVLLRAFMAQDQ